MRLPDLVVPLPLVLACLASQSLACQPLRPPSASNASSQPALPSSSIAAILLHRDELQLTDDQVRSLRSANQHLAEEVAEIQARAMPPPTSRPAKSGSSPLQMTAGPGGGGGRHRPGGGGGGLPPADPARPSMRRVQQKIDDADTRAYLQAESEILTDAQRAQAREIAEQYREQLYDRRPKTDDDDE